MSVDLTKGATVELVKTLSDDLRTRDDNTKYSSAGAAMRDKANVDGYYENLVSGGTEQLLSSVYEEDSEPYLFRTSGGAIDIGDREEDTIVGGTIAWNQYAKAFATGNYIAQGGGSSLTFENGVATLDVTANYNRFVMTPTVSNNAHKLLVSCEMNTDYTGSFMWGVWSSNGTNTSMARAVKTVTTLNTWLTLSTVGILDGGTDNKIAFQSNSGTGTVKARNGVVIDLTQMFGTTIADYIYGLETATAGAGVAFFKKLFPKTYYAYDAGSLKSVEGLSAHKMTGFNQWDEQWELGTYDQTTGEKAASVNYIRNKNAIPVLPNTVYYISLLRGGVWLGYYDASENYISFENTAGGTFTTPSDAHYLCFHTYSGYGKTYNNDICINLHWDGERDGEYEPYEEHVYDLDSSLTLRGLPKLDENNNLYYDGDVYKADGTVERKYGIVDLGTLTWNVDSNRVGVVYTNGIATPSKSYGYIRTVDYLWREAGVPSSATVSTYDKQISLYPSYGGGYVYIIDHAFDSKTAAEVKTALSGKYAIYELTAPTTETAQPYAQNQTVNDFGTEEYVSETNIIPVGHETKYMPNLKAKLEMAPDSPSDNGDYIVRHTNGQNEYVPLVIPTELPAMPTDNGTYHLKVTVTNGTAVVSWESE